MVLLEMNQIPDGTGLATSPEKSQGSDLLAPLMVQDLAGLVQSQEMDVENILIHLVGTGLEMFQEILCKIQILVAPLMVQVLGGLVLYPVMANLETNLKPVGTGTEMYHVIHCLILNLVAPLVDLALEPQVLFPVMELVMMQMSPVRIGHVPLLVIKFLVPNLVALNRDLELLEHHLLCLSQENIQMLQPGTGHEANLEKIYRCLD